MFKCGMRGPRSASPHCSSPNNVNWIPKTGLLRTGKEDKFFPLFFLFHSFIFHYSLHSYFPVLFSFHHFTSLHFTPPLFASTILIPFLSPFLLIFHRHISYPNSAVVYSIPFHSILFHSIPFHLVLFFSFPPPCFVTSLHVVTYFLLSIHKFSSSPIIFFPLLLISCSPKLPLFFVFAFPSSSPLAFHQHISSLLLYSHSTNLFVGWWACWRCRTAWLGICPAVLCT